VLTRFRGCDYFLLGIVKSDYLFKIIYEITSVWVPFEWTGQTAVALSREGLIFMDLKATFKWFVILWIFIDLTDRVVGCDDDTFRTDLHTAAFTFS